MAVKEQIQEMVDLRKSGKTYQEIADMYGVSKQHIHKIISDVCRLNDITRKYSFDIENIVYEGVYELFANDKRMTITKLSKIIYGVALPTHNEKEKVRRLILGQGESNFSIRNINNVLDYAGKPFEEVFKVRW